MSDEEQPKLPEDKPGPEPSSQPIKPEPMSRGRAALWGFGLFIGSIVFGIFTSGVGCLIGIAVAIGALFFPGYRYVCLGFFLSFVISVGLVCLFAVIVCSGPGGMDLK
jgi:hypothetical protein